MRRKLLFTFCTLFAAASIALVVIQLLQTQRSVTMSESLFSVSVSNAMDDVVSQLNRLKVEDYINQNDRYKLLKYKRVEELNATMREIVKERHDLLSDRERVRFGTELQDSAVVLRPALLSAEEARDLERYNTLLSNRNKLMRNENYYDQFVTDISQYVFDNLLSSNAFNYPMLDSLIADNLQEAGIDIRARIGVLNNTADTFLYVSPNGSRTKLRESPYRYSLKPDGNLRANEYFIMLQFPSSARYLSERSNRYLVLSIVLMVIIMVLFLLTVRSIFLQRKLDEMKNDFISNMTHEIKTPIATVSLACEMLRDKSVAADPAMQDNFLGIIQNENHRMQMLVETILQSNKMGSKKFVMNPTEVDVHRIVEEVARSFDMQVRSRNGSLTLDLQATPPTLFADTLHLTNAIYNLVDNALKYSPGRVEIGVSTRNEGDRLVLVVWDHGVGISKEDQRHVFEKFYRVSTGNVHDVKGFGIGLSYVQQVVLLHHGSISVNSTVGQGSSFTISLPRT